MYNGVALAEFIEVRRSDTGRFLISYQRVRYL